MLTRSQLESSVDSIVRLQLDNGLILWTPNGHADPWNHVESAMALDAGGRVDEARAAYSWMQKAQRADGSWHQYYTAHGIEDAKFDANTIAYVATGVWHHFLTTDDSDWLADQWTMVEQALGWVLELQQATGEILWAREPDGTPFHYALVTGSSSIHHSLGCAVRIAERLGIEARPWADARTLLGRALSEHQLEFFAEKDRWAMDWYYPVLGGVFVNQGEAMKRITSRWHEFVIPGEGVRCVHDHPWVTTGETAEAAIACAIAGMHTEAVEIFSTTEKLRYDDGSYWTGLHVPSRAWFPEGERTVYSAAAVVLADSVLRRGTPTAEVFGVS